MWHDAANLAIPALCRSKLLSAASSLLFSRLWSGSKLAGNSNEIGTYGGFHKRLPENGWFISENPIKTHDN